MSQVLIHNLIIINEGSIYQADLLIEGERISKINKSGIQATKPGTIEIDANGLYCLPGVIDTQVHFREPGLTHKDDLFSASRSGVSGGVTSFMDMPNTNPRTLTQELLEEKFQLAKAKSLANYSFFMGTSNTNAEEVLKTNPKTVCGIKIFLGASTGDMLVDNEDTIRTIFSKNHPYLPISLHCEDESTIRKNLVKFREKYGDEIPVEFHPAIRSEEACYLSSSFAVGLAKEYNTRIHVLHLSTAKEMELFQQGGNLREKKITAEVCIHHLLFCEEDYKTRRNSIKWNPAIKSAKDRDGLWKALLEDRLDIIATDHAPHTIEEKSKNYIHCPSGSPMVAHSLVVMLEFARQGKISLEKVVHKMCHAPADVFRIQDRGYIREGYYADLAIVDLHSPWTVSKENINYKCGYSPLEGMKFHSQVIQTFVNGKLVYDRGKWDESVRGMRLVFDRG